MPQQGSAGNVVGAVASFFIPGLGQLVQGRPAEAAMWFFTVILGTVFALVTVGLFGVLVGLGLHLYNVYEAAVWEGPGTLPGDPRVAGRLEDA